MIKLSEEEIIQQFQNNNDNVQLNRIKDTLKNISNDVNNLQKTVNSLISLCNADMSELLPTIYAQADSFNSIYYSIYRKLGQLLNYSAYKNPNVPIESKDINIYKENESIIVIIPELLPKRNYGKHAGYSRDMLLGMYRKAFQRYFENTENKIYKDKVLIHITFYFKENSHLTDLDNFETKVILDLITGYCLIDDSPKYCSLLLDHKIGDREKTIIKIHPIEREL